MRDDSSVGDDGSTRDIDGGVEGRGWVAGPDTTEPDWHEAARAQSAEAARGLVSASAELVAQALASLVALCTLLGTLVGVTGAALYVEGAGTPAGRRAQHRRRRPVAGPRLGRVAGRQRRGAQDRRRPAGAGGPGSLFRYQGSVRARRALRDGRLAEPGAQPEGRVVHRRRPPGAPRGAGPGLARAGRRRDEPALGRRRHQRPDSGGRGRRAGPRLRRRPLRLRAGGRRRLRLPRRGGRGARRRQRPTTRCSRCRCPRWNR